MASQPDPNSHQQEKSKETEKKEAQNEERVKEADQNNSIASRPPPPHQYPGQTMGYPPNMGYPPPGGQPPPMYYGQYNYNYQYGPYNYQHPQPNPYYNNNAQMHHAHDLHQQAEIEASRLARCIIIGFITTILIMCLISVATWLVLRPQLPVFHVDSFSVSNFSAKTSAFNANWDANITVRNPNTKLRIYFDEIETFIFYDDNVPLATSVAQPFALDVNSGNVMRAMLASTDKDVDRDAVDDLAKDQRQGTVRFSLRMMMLVTLKSGSSGSRRNEITVYCEKLDVSFVGDTGNGNAIKPRDNCIVLF